MRGANLITTSSKCSVRAIKKGDNNAVDADFHAVKGHYRRSALQAGHQPNCSHVLPVGLCNMSPFSPPPSMTPTPEDTMGLVVGQEGEEMGRNLEKQNETWGARNGARQLGSMREVKARGATK